MNDYLYDWSCIDRSELIIMKIKVRKGDTRLVREYIWKQNSRNCIFVNIRRSASRLNIITEQKFIISIDRDDRYNLIFFFKFSILKKFWFILYFI